MLAQSRGQDFLFPCCPPTVLKCPCTGPCPCGGCDYFQSILCTVPFNESHLLVLTLNKPLSGFLPRRLRSALFSDGHGKIKADLARGLAATKGSVQVFSLEVRKPPSQLLDS